MELEKFTQKTLMSRALFSPRMLVVGLILSVTFFLVLLDSFRIYRSEISILVSAKSDVAARQEQQIVSNIAELPKTLAFYDRLLTFNPDVRDVTAGLSDEQRKAKWNEMLTVSRAGFGASVINIAITTSREADSIQLVNKTARTLFDTSAFYYNIKNDLDMRIIDGPITRVQVTAWHWLFLLSISAGFAVSGILQQLIFGSKKISISRPDFLKRNSFFDFKKTPKMPAEQELESLNDLYRSQQAEEPFAFQQKTEYNEQTQENTVVVSNYDKKFQEIKKITKQLEPDKYPNFPEMPSEHQWTASVPDNLPVAEDSYFAPLETSAEPVQPEVTETEKEAAPEIAKEPTPEELKKRLNELLKGGL